MILLLSYLAISMKNFDKSLSDLCWDYRNINGNRQSISKSATFFFSILAKVLSF